MYFAIGYVYMLIALYTFHLDGDFCREVHSFILKYIIIMRLREIMIFFKLCDIAMLQNWYVYSKGGQPQRGSE